LTSITRSHTHMVTDSGGDRVHHVTGISNFVFLKALQILIENKVLTILSVPYNSYNKSQQDAPFLNYFGKQLYMFRMNLQSIIRSLNTVFTATGICHTTSDDCLLATSLANSQHN